MRYFLKSDGRSKLTILEETELESGAKKLKKICSKIVNEKDRVINEILNSQLDEDGRPAMLGNRILKKGYSGTVQVNEEIAGKFSLIFLLSGGVSGSRLQLMERRVQRFTREEAMYWLGKITIPIYGEKARKWAVAGVRMMLCGGPSAEKECRNIIETKESR